MRSHNCQISGGSAGMIHILPSLLKLVSEMSALRFHPRSNIPFPPSSWKLDRLTASPLVPSAITAAVSANDQSPPDGALKIRERKVGRLAVIVNPCSMRSSTGAVALPVIVISSSSCAQIEKLMLVMRFAWSHVAYVRRQGTSSKLSCRTCAMATAPCGGAVPDEPG